MNLAGALRELRSSTLMRLVRGSLAVRGLGVLSGFCMHVALSRLLGPDGAGVFYLAMTLLLAAGVIGKFGLDTALMRFAGPFAEREEWARVNGIYWQACAVSASISALVAALLAISADWWALQVFANPAVAPVILMLAIAVVPFSLVWVQSGILKAVGRPVAATLVEAALLPTLVCLGVLLLALVDEVSPVTAASCYVIATLLVFSLGGLLFRAGPGGRGPAERVPVAELLHSCRSLAMIDFMNFVMAWSIFPILGYVGPESEVGIFNAAQRLAIQFTTILVVFGGIVGPKFAAMYERRDLPAMEQLAARTTSYMTLAALPVAAVLLAFPELVPLIFGPEFSRSGPVLQVLVIGQLINLATGPAGYLLVMSGHQVAMRNILLATLVGVLPLSLLLAQWQGALGAAIAVSCGLAVQNVLALIVVRLRLGMIGLPGLTRLRPLEET